MPSKLYVKYLFAASPLNMSTEEKMEVDNRSIYVGNVSDNTCFIRDSTIYAVLCSLMLCGLWQ
jgi:hypothetical protein